MRLRFRPYRPTDTADVEAMFADPQARRFYPDMGPEGAERWIAWNLRNYDDLGFGLWAVEDCASGRFLGDCGLTYQVADGERLLEIGYHVTAEHRGCGYATEAAAACREFAFETLGADVVVSIVDPRNEPSIAVARRIHEAVRSCNDGRGERRLLYSTTMEQHRGED
jgi:RimJ/RimL family protein N-acetyltransferase